MGLSAAGIMNAILWGESQSAEPTSKLQSYHTLGYEWISGAAADAGFVGMKFTDVVEACLLNKLGFPVALRRQEYIDCLNTKDMWFVSVNPTGAILRESDEIMLIHDVRGCLSTLQELSEKTEAEQDFDTVSTPANNMHPFLQGASPEKEEQFMNGAAPETEEPSHLLTQL